ncbi:MAG TPA: ATP-binding cassette domain-containing protein, partial [Burkholderiales bacterium]|nr:ATP-binding cassette domain-containing protein [Burkholderiales bacterium]
RALEALGRVGMRERASARPGELSGGQKQRLAIARALFTGPKLLLADEPTGNLDATTGADIIDLIFRLNAEEGTTLVLVTHDEALARRCARQIRLAGGRIHQ